MSVQLFLPNGTQINFHEVAGNNSGDLILPGSKILENGIRTATIAIQDLENPFFSISHRLFNLFAKVNLTVSEKPGLRLEAILKGEIDISDTHNKLKLTAGQYHLTDVPQFKALFKKTSACSIFITHFSYELLEQLGITVPATTPTLMTPEMDKLVQQILRNPYEGNLRNFYYENSVRELLFFHLSQGQRMPGQVENKDIAMIFQADAILKELKHHSIEKLSRMIGTNKFKLKTGFKKVFGTGVYERLKFLRMEKAKELLLNTDKSITEISELAGYETVAGFVHAFGEEFNMTPREWRLKMRGH